MPLQLQTKIRFFSTGDRRQRISSLIAAGTETRQSYPLQKHQTQGWVVLYDNQHTSSCEFLSKAGTLGREVTKNALMPSVFADVLRERNDLSKYSRNYLHNHRQNSLKFRFMTISEFR